MNQSKQYTKSFYQTHDKYTRKFITGQLIEMEKKPNPNGKLLTRKVRLEEQYMRQIKNQKQIKYPSGFLIITKQEFEKLPEIQKAVFKWTTIQNKNIRVLFDRSDKSPDKLQIQEFSKPTAVYFDDIQTGMRFAEFLKFQNQQKLNHFNEILTKLQRVWFHVQSIKIIQSQVDCLNAAARKFELYKKEEQDEFVIDSNDLFLYDKRIYEQMFGILYQITEQEKEKQEQMTINQKIITLQNQENFIKQQEIKATIKLLQLWQQTANQKFHQKDNEEEYQQRELDEEEKMLQDEILPYQDEKESLSQSQVLLEQQSQHLPQHKDLHLTNFKLIIDKQISLLNPILHIQFKGLESKKIGKMKYNRGQEINFMELDCKGWTTELEVTLSGFQNQDALDLVIYDYQEVNEKILARAQEQQSNVLAFLTTAKKVMQGRIYMRELEKNLNNNRRHFAGMEISANLLQIILAQDLFNKPMIQMDIHEDSPFKIHNSTVNPFYLDIIEIPFTAQELKYFVRQLKSPHNSLQQQWDSFKLDALENALQVRGQIWVNSKQSEDDLIEIQEYILEEQGVQEQKDKFILISEYLQLNQIQDQQCFVKNKIIDACKKGFTRQSRKELIPIFLQFDTNLQKFTNDIGLEWNENQNILEILKNEVNQYIDQETKYANSQKIQNYIDGINFKEITIWTEQYIKKIQSWKDRLTYLLDCFELSIHTKNKMVLTIKLFQLFNLLEDYDEFVFKIIYCLQYNFMVPNFSLDKFDILWLKSHLNSLFCEFFYFDIWLRVFDYIIGVGFANGDLCKAIGSVIGGILIEVDHNQYRTKEEFMAGLCIYGKLLCDPEKLIKACYKSYNQHQFINLDSDDQIIGILIQNGNPIDQICKDQIEQLKQNQQSFIIDVPEEHEGSVYELQEQQQQQQAANFVRSQPKYLFKQKVERIYILIHSMYLHQIRFYEQDIVSIQQQIKTEQDGFYFELPYTTNILEIEINETFTGQIDVDYFLVNTVYKNQLILNDKYNMERDYQISELEYSILLIGEGLQHGKINSQDSAINSFNDLASQFNVQHNFLSHPDTFKIGNQLNLGEFKQLMKQYFQLDPTTNNLDELYQGFLLNGNQQIYLIDILLKLCQDKSKQLEILTLFNPNKKISHKQLRRQGLESGSVKFLKVKISDQNYEQSIDLTDYFNNLLLNHYQKYNSYDMLLFDQNNRLYLLDNAGSFLQQLRTQTLNFKLKFSSYGNIRNLEYQITRKFKLILELQKSVTSIKELLENNERIISLDNNQNLKVQNLMKHNQHLVRLKFRDASKQFEICNIIGQIKNKDDQLQFYVIELENAKGIIVYKEDVILFDRIQLEELQVFQKNWKHQQ